MRDLRSVVRSGWRVRNSVLVTGGAGTGKSWSRAPSMSRATARGSRSMCVNCAAIPDALGQRASCSASSAAPSPGRPHRQEAQEAHAGSIFFIESADVRPTPAGEFCAWSTRGEICPLGGQRQAPVDFELEPRRMARRMVSYRHSERGSKTEISVSMGARVAPAVTPLVMRRVSAMPRSKSVQRSQGSSGSSVRTLHGHRACCTARVSGNQEDRDNVNWSHQPGFRWRETREVLGRLGRRGDGDHVVRAESPPYGDPPQGRRCAHRYRLHV